jgi:hypothetical protein
MRDQKLSRKKIAGHTQQKIKESPVLKSKNYFSAILTFMVVY